MSISLELRVAAAQAVHLTDDALIIDLLDGRTISAPLTWYPRLLYQASFKRWLESRTR